MTMLMGKITIALLTSLFIFVLPASVWAQKKAETPPPAVPQVEVQVDRIANVFEKFKEKVTLFFKFSKEDKFDYQKFILEKRLAELKFVIDSKEWDPVEETSSRYAAYLGNFSDFVLKSKLAGKKEEVLKIYERHGKILEDLQKNFKFESGWWLLLQHDINSIKIFTDRVKSL